MIGTPSLCSADRKDSCNFSTDWQEVLLFSCYLCVHSQGLRSAAVAAHQQSYSCSARTQGLRKASSCGRTSKVTCSARTHRKASIFSLSQVIMIGTPSLCSADRKDHRLQCYSSHVRAFPGTKKAAVAAEPAKSPAAQEPTEKPASARVSGQLLQMFNVSDRLM